MSVSIMKKLTVLTPAGEADELVHRLMRLRCVDIRTVPPDGEGLIRHDCDAARAEAERRVAQVTEAIPFLERYVKYDAKYKKKSKGDKLIRTDAALFRRAGNYDAARGVVEEVLELKARLADLQAEESRAEGRLRALTPWLSCDLPLDTESTDACFVWMGVMPPDTTISGMEDLLADVHAGVEEVLRDGEGVYVTVVFHREDEDVAARTLGEAGFLRCPFKGLTGTAAEAYAATQRRMEEIDNDIQACTDRLGELSQMLEDLKVLYDVEMTDLLSVRQRQKMAETGSCVVLEGWIPAQRTERVTATLDRMACAYDLADPVPGEEPPILLKNNGYASNFEWVVGMYAYPKYGTFDPTFVMSIFYFVIFGLMFADVGYGLLLLVGGFLLPKLLRMKDGMRRMLNMFGYCGIACTILGFVFGGWFGDLPYAIMTGFMGYESTEAAKAAAPLFNGLGPALGGLPFSLNPLDNPMAFLVISLAMGAIHLVGAMAVKFVLLCKEGRIWAAIFDVGSYWILFAGLGALVFNATVGWITVGVGALMIVATQGRAQKNPVMKFLMGLKGLYDLISYASDLLSYCRILALGLAAAVMAQVFNLLATMGGPTVPGYILMVVILLIGHVLNIAINLLGAFVHTSRLQYLEFFGKFYEDGGEPFDPALPSDKYSTVESEETEADTATSDATRKMKKA